MKNCSLLALLLSSFISSARANDNMLIFTTFTNVVYGTMNYNNGFQDWGWVPHYYTNNPNFNGTNSIAFAASSGYQALELEHDPIDTTLYTSVTLWLNGGSSGGQQVGLDAANGANWGSTVYVTAPKNSWQQFTFTLSSLGVAGTTNLQGFRIWNNSTAQPTFYVADIELVAAAPPPTVHVTVNATDTVRTVDPRIFGINTAGWDADLDTANTISILNSTSNQELRWPGGSWGDIYFMTNEAAKGWGSVTTNFLHVATNTGAQISFIVNYGSGTPQQAADWVRFCETTNHCHVKYWEVGNECYGSWEQDNNTNAPDQAHDPWTYAQRFTAYYTAMKAVDPTIHVGAVADVTEDGSANYTNHPVVTPVTGVTHNGWTPVLLTYLRSNNITPDFLIIHSYAPSDGDTYNLLWTKTCAVNAGNVRVMLNDYLGTGLAAEVELCQTEFGPEDDRQWISLVGGLYYADTVGQTLQTEFNTLLWWDLRNGVSTVDPSDNALYGWRTNSSGVYLTDEGICTGLATGANLYPSYYCMKLLQHFAQGGDTVLSAGDDYELLSTYAVRRTNGCLTLLVVNKSSYATLSADFNISGYTPSTNATTYSYGMPQDTAARTGVGSMDVAQSSFSGAASTFTDSFAPYSATVMVFNPSAPALVVPASQPSGKFAFQVQGLTGVPYQIQVRSSLSSGQWTTISTNTGTVTLTNTISGGAQFYRAVWKP
jgi:hypothetical protein